MLNIGRNDRWVDLKDPNKPAAKPTGTVAQPAPATVSPNPPTARSLAAQSVPEPAVAPRDVSPQPSPEEVAGSKLFVGVNIKLKGVEISNCDVLVIEGQVDATINSKVMEISKPGTLTGTALIDIAEIHGEFSGELTARTKLVVHGTGRVTGTVRYGKLVVAEGGTLNGELRQIDAATPATKPAPSPQASPEARQPAQGSSEQRGSGHASAEQRAQPHGSAEPRASAHGSAERTQSQGSAEPRTSSAGSEPRTAPGQH